MKVNNITNQAFYGYKNVITGENIPIDDKRVTFVSMQLNNEDGFDDLNRYLELRRMQGLPEHCIDEDVLILSYVADSKGNNLYLGNTRKPMFWGEELLKLRKINVPRLMTEEEYNKIERIHLRAYTILANITKRMMNDNNLQKLEADKAEEIIADNITQRKNMDFYRVFNSLVKSLSYVLETEKAAYEAANIGKMVNVPYQKVAGEFNRGICKSMQKFFK